MTQIEKWKKQVKNMRELLFKDSKILNNSIEGNTDCIDFGISKDMLKEFKCRKQKKSQEQ